MEITPKIEIREVEVVTKVMQKEFTGFTVELSAKELLLIYSLTGCVTGGGKTREVNDRIFTTIEKIIRDTHIGKDHFKHTPFYQSTLMIVNDSALDSSIQDLKEKYSQETFN